MTRDIEIKNGSQVARINKLACDAPYEVWLSTDSVMLDARSLLGLFALIGQKARVVADDSIDPKRFQKLVTRMM